MTRSRQARAAGRAAAIVAASAILTACGSAGAPPHAPAARAPTPATVWLCRPGLAHDPCTASEDTTIVRADGSRTVERAAPAKDPPIDCFYVYPTVSTQTTPNANLHIDPQETDVAFAQASRFSSACRVYAPMYPQLTLREITKTQISPSAALTAYLGLLSAWDDYLAHDNHGRGVVLIGHSQGASLLIALIRNVIDPNAAQRRLLVSALLLGGNVIVPAGRTVGGDFAHIPACASAVQTGCVVAYSSFATPPPADSFFGRVGTGIGADAGLGTHGATQVLCTNPAALAGGGGALLPYFPTLSDLGGARAPATITTPWISYPGLYTGSCEHRGGASWLAVTAVQVAGDGRPRVQQTLGPQWGLHLVDVNIALGNLVALVARQGQTFTRATKRAP